MEGTASTLVTELISTLTTTASQMEGAIGDVMGVALPLAGSILALSCLTDMADGIIARKLHRITNVGKVLDPLADKLTQFALILSLSAKYSILYPVLALFLAKELAENTRNGFGI